MASAALNPSNAVNRFHGGAPTFATPDCHGSSLLDLAYDLAFAPPTAAHHPHFGVPTYLAAAAVAAAASGADGVENYNPLNWPTESGPFGGGFGDPFAGHHHHHHHHHHCVVPRNGMPVQRITPISGSNNGSGVTSGTGNVSSSSGSSHHGSHKSKPRRRVATVAQRRAANIRERRRMYNLNSAFDKLRKKVPTFAYEKRLSRIETLRLAIMYIEFMTSVVTKDYPLHGSESVWDGPPPSDQLLHVCSSRQI